MPGLLVCRCWRPAASPPTQGFQARGIDAAFNQGLFDGVGPIHGQLFVVREDTEITEEI